MIWSKNNKRWLAQACCALLLQKRAPALAPPAHS